MFLIHIPVRNLSRNNSLIFIFFLEFQQKLLYILKTPDLLHVFLLTFYFQQKVKNVVFLRTIFVKQLDSDATACRKCTFLPDLLVKQTLFNLGGNIIYAKKKLSCCHFATAQVRVAQNARTGVGGMICRYNYCAKWENTLQIIDANNPNDAWVTNYVNQSFRMGGGEIMKRLIFPILYGQFSI